MSLFPLLWNQRTLSSTHDFSMSVVSVNVIINLLVSQAWPQVTNSSQTPHSFSHQAVKILPLQGVSHLTLLCIPTVITLNQELKFSHMGYLLIHQSHQGCLSEAQSRFISLSTGTTSVAPLQAWHYGPSMIWLSTFLSNFNLFTILSLKFQVIST